MIKWFDADKFLPGKHVGEVLVRQSIHDQEPCYVLGEHLNGSWFDEHANEFSYVTHWAHINEPFE